MDAEAAAKRLADAGQGHARRLAELSVDELFRTPLQELFPEERAVAAVRDGLKAWLESDTAILPVDRALKAIVAELEQSREPLAELVPEELLEGAEAWLARPWSPDRAVALAALDRAPVRALIRKLLLDAILEFGRGMGGGTVGGMARGLGGLAKMAAERTGTLGALVGAVGGEVERQLERRASEFVDLALSGIIQKLADEFSSPARAKQQAELRVAIFEGLLKLNGAQLARELLRADPVGGNRIVRDALSNWLEQPEAAAQLERAAKKLLAHESHRPLGEVLAELGLLAVAREHAASFLEARILKVAGTAAFKEFLGALLRP